MDDMGNAIWKMRTLVYSTADTDTCVVPTFPDLSWDLTIVKVSSFQLGSDLLLFGEYIENSIQTRNDLLVNYISGIEF